MPSYVVEIEWPLSGNDIGTAITPSALVRDEDDSAPPPPAVDHFVQFTLFFTGGGGDVQKSQQSSNVFDPAVVAANQTAISPTAPLSTDVTGEHRLKAELKKTDGTVVDVDEETGLNAIPTGPQQRPIDILNATFED